MADKNRVKQIAMKIRANKHMDMEDAEKVARKIMREDARKKRG